MLGEKGPLEILLPQLVKEERGAIGLIVFQHARYVDPFIRDALTSWATNGTYDGEKVGKMLLRFWKVLQAYQSKKAGWDSARLAQVRERVFSLFGGSNPSALLDLLFPGR